MLTKEIKIGGVSVGGKKPLFIIAGPCVIESEEVCFDAAEGLKEMTDKLGIIYIFKASYDKANRSSIGSYRGPGIEKGLKILARVKKKFNVPVLTDVHGAEEAKAAAEVVDILQIPAFLSRQTDLLIAAGETGLPVNVKKSQMMSPEEMQNIIEKLESAGCEKIILTERGTSFGYNNLVNDFRVLPVMRRLGYPVVFDATHSVQHPGGLGNASGGDREFVPVLARAAVAVGVDGVFLEVHPNPDAALCDGPNSLKLSDVGPLLARLVEIDGAAAARG